MAFLNSLPIYPTRICSPPLLALRKRESGACTLTEFHSYLMTNIFKIAGRLYGRAARSDAVKSAVRSFDMAKRSVVREAGIAQMRLRITFLRRKHTVHLTLLGKTVHRLIKNEIDPSTHPQVRTIIAVLGEIECEIAAAEEELRRRAGEKDA